MNFSLQTPPEPATAPPSTRDLPELPRQSPERPRSSAGKYLALGALVILIAGGSSFWAYPE